MPVRIMVSEGVTTAVILSEVERSAAISGAIANTKDLHSTCTLNSTQSH